MNISHRLSSNQLLEKTLECHDTKSVVDQTSGLSRKSEEKDITIREIKSESGPVLRKYHFESSFSFEGKSYKMMTPIEAMPSGPDGVKTTWNPDGLNTKKLLEKRYRDQNNSSELFGYFYTPHTPLSRKEGKRLVEQVFKVTRGHDIAVARTHFNNDGSISAEKHQPYEALAPELDKIVANMVRSRRYDQKSARKRVGRDIIRVGSGREIKGRYEAYEWKMLAEFAMVIRADKARAPGSTRYYIDKYIKDNSTSFKNRFGDKQSALYEGAREGGARKIKLKEELYKDEINPTLTDSSSSDCDL